MEANAAQFSGRVAEYERYRERFDPEVILPKLREWCGLTPSWAVADVGAGTGMLSDTFLANGNRVVAIEPNPEMRAACSALHSGERRLQVLEGTAERTGLADGSVDMVSVGRALHWFDLPVALEEMRRVLRPGGWVAIVGLGRKTGARKENRELEALLQDFSPDSRPTHEAYKAYTEVEEAFAGGRYLTEEISSEVSLPWPQFQGLVASLSHAPLPSSAVYPQFAARLLKLFAAFQHDGLFTLATRCWLAAGQFPD